MGDVGEKNREEIDLVERGGNYGWARMEGNLCRDPEGCDDSLIPPVFEYGREEGLAVIGGFVYQGSRWPGLAGLYLFGDFGTRKVWALRRDGEAWSSELLAVADKHVLAFGRDAEDEFYVLARNAVYRLESAAGRELPRPRLSETGVFSSMRSQEPASGVMAVRGQRPALVGRRRQEALPRAAGGGPHPLPQRRRLGVSRRDRAGQELLRRRADRRDAAADQADRVPGVGRVLLQVERGQERGLPARGGQGPGSTRSPRRTGAAPTSHYFPSRGQCGDCHTPASGYVLGLRTGQMNRDGLIESWEREGLFAGGLPPPREWAKWPEPEDESLPLGRGPAPTSPPTAPTAIARATASGRSSTCASTRR